MADHDALLKRFAPVLRYDSNEQYFADSAEQWTGCPRNELRRANDARGKQGKVLAKADPTAGEPKLTLAFLGRKTYADGTPALDDDVIAHDGQDYGRSYRALRTQRPELKNVMYGHAVVDNDRLWLQYWFWYFYNDYRLAFDAGLHEGDWEMVALRMHPTADHPDLAVYAQHRNGEKREWEAVEKKGERPVVYVARGSHAAYYERGFHQTEAWYDLADGRREAPALRLELFDPKTHAFMLWRGTWGDTRPSPEDMLKLHSGSPTGPCRKRQWAHPNEWLDKAVESKRVQAQKKPDVVPVRAGGVLAVRYDFRKRDPRPASLLVTLNSRDEQGVAPRTHTFVEDQFDPAGEGEFVTDVALDPLKNYDVYTSTVAGDPAVYSESRLRQMGPIAAGKGEPWFKRIPILVSLVVARLRGDR